MLGYTMLLILVSFSAFSYIKRGEATSINDKSENSVKKYEPFLVTTLNAWLSPESVYELPTSSDLIVKDRTGVKWQLASQSTNKFLVSLCPELRTKDPETKIVFETLNQVFPDSKKCLFVKKLQTNEQDICETEPQMSLQKRKQDDGSTVTCGVNDQQQLIDAQYYNCDSDQNLVEYAAKVIQATHKGIDEVPKFEPIRYVMYEICYDFQRNQTLWTKYTPKTLPLSPDKNAFYKIPDKVDIEDFSTDISSLNLSSVTFENLKKSYQLTSPSITLVHTLVPKDHMTLLYWKTATNHMINSAPLLQELIPIMNTINDGILNASHNLFAKSNKILKIYTKAETEVIPMMNFVSSYDIIKEEEIRLKLKENARVNLFKPNIWYKFVYDESEKSGVLIVLHNTRDALPEQRECSDDEIIYCNIKKWSDYSNLISDRSLKNVYCCRVSEERVKQIYSINELQLEELFDIRAMIPTKNEYPETFHNRKRNMSF